MPYRQCPYPPPYPDCWNTNQVTCYAGHDSEGCYLGYVCGQYYNSTSTCFTNKCPVPNCGPHEKLCKSNVFYGDNCPSYEARCIQACTSEWNSLTNTSVQCENHCQIDCHPNTEVKCFNGYNLEDGCSLGYSCHPVKSKILFALK